MTEQALPENAYFRINNYYVDVGDHKIFQDDKGRHLEPKAMQVLYQLALCAGETVSRQELMNKVWHGRVVIEDSLTRVISQLRLNFNDSKTRQLIQTVPKKGYRLFADVTWLTRQEFIKRSIDVASEHAANPALQNNAEQPVDSLTDHNANQALEHKSKNVTTNSPIRSLVSSFNKGKAAVLISLSLISILLMYAFLVGVLKPQEHVNDEFISDTIDTATQNSEINFPHTPITMAFLPWRNLTGDDNNDYLAEMLPEELSITLAKSDKINVLSHYSSLALARDPRALDSLAEHYNLEYWVEGSVTEAAERIRLLVRLVEEKSNNAIWSQVYEDEMQQLLVVNERIITDINQALFGQSSQKNFTTSPNNIDINAYRSYLQGNYWLMNGKTSEWFSQAEAAFLQATELAPNFASAFGSLAFIYARYNYHDVYMEKTVALAKASTAIDKALQLDANDINALLAQAVMFTEELQFESAQVLIEKVLSIDASNTRGLYIYSEWALARNQFDVALIYADKALQIDPLSPWINVNKAIVHFWRNEMDKALLAVDQAINIDSNYTWAYVWKAKILSQKGQLADAIETMQICLQIDNGSPVNSIYLALLYARAEMPKQAQKWFSHTASLYGDSPDARFWQSYLSFIKQQEDPNITQQLVNQVTLKTTRFFSIVPLQTSLLLSQPELIETALPEFLSLIKREEQSDFWINHRNQYSAYAALALMQQLDNVEYDQQLEWLKAEIKAFERKVALPLTADLK